MMLSSYSKLTSTKCHMYFMNPDFYTNFDFHLDFVSSKIAIQPYSNFGNFFFFSEGQEPNFAECCLNNLLLITFDALPFPYIYE